MLSWFNYLPIVTNICCIVISVIINKHSKSDAYSITRFNAPLSIWQYKWIYYLHALVLWCVTLLLLAGYLSDQFNLQLVQQSSSINLALHYKIGAILATSTGSLLVFFAIYASICAYFQKSLLVNNASHYTLYQLRAHQVNLLCLLSSSCIIAHLKPLAYTKTNLPHIGLNPILQDHAILIHPPMLYTGYALSLFCAILIVTALGSYYNSLKTSNIQHHTTHDPKYFQQLSTYLKPCINLIRIAWVVTLAGISLGSNWAYRELGWGGYWFYDPIENLSLMVLVSLTAMYHMVIYSLKSLRYIRLMYITARFSLYSIILNLLISRWGGVISVHAFMSNEVDWFNPVILITIVFAVYEIYIAYVLRSVKPNNYSHTTKSKAIFAGVILLCFKTLILFISIITPILYSSFYGVEIQVNTIFFYRFFNPQVLLILLLMALFVKELPLYKISAVSLPISFLILSLLQLYKISWEHSLYIICAVFCLLNSLILMKQKLSGMLISHAGFALLILSITMNKALEREWVLKANLNIPIHLVTPYGNLKATVLDVNHRQEDSFYTGEANLAVQLNQNHAILTPELRVYKDTMAVSTESSLAAYLLYDLYAVYEGPYTESGKQQASEHQQHIIRLSFRPFMLWIWASVFFTILGAVFNLFRFRHKRA